MTVHSAGNSGYSGCETVNEPAAIYAESFTVGSVDSNDIISNFSSRGPVSADGSNRFKPQVSAPGSGIRSSLPNGSYGYKSGTSMAAPHVTGLVALLISAQPHLTGQVNALETLIEKSAQPLFTSEDCGGDTSTSHPNHTYGWGRIDAWAALQKLPLDIKFFPIILKDQVSAGK
jgi:subtilisin family serine protease